MSESNNQQHHDHEQGRSGNRSRRRNPSKGLPDEAALTDLARTWVEQQRRLWPGLARLKMLPPVADKTIAELARQFRERFLGEGVPPYVVTTQRAVWKRLGAAYLRYSCDNSNPRSLDQQLKNVLERAARECVFIPWEYVFADAAVSGTTAARRGYQMAKAAVELRDGAPHDFYVDEIGRASRDAIEALTLGRRIEAFKKRLVGVTDGFDSDEAFSQLKLHIFAMVQQWFVDQLKSKVLRGMADGFAQGKNLGKPALGYKLVPMTDSAGRVLADEYGRPVMTKVIDEDVARYVREAFRLFAVEHWSKGRIAKWFNSERVGGLTSWDGTLIRQLLRRETYFGVEYYGMTYRVVDPETGGITIVRRPQKEWKRRDVPDLRIVPTELETKAKERLAACREAYRKRAGDANPTAGRTSVYPTTLVRPECGYCRRPLYLGRSGKYASFCCPNGSAGKKGCRLRNYKMVGIVEKAVVGHLQTAVFTPEFVAGLVGKANAFLHADRKRPKENTAWVRAEIKDLTAKRDRLVRLYEKSDGDLDDVVAKLKKYQAQLTVLQTRLREAEGPTEVLTPVTATDVEAAVADLHALLREDVTTIAPILRELTGPVKVTMDEKQQGKRGAAWIARFEANMVPVLACLTRRRNCPTSGAWEYLHTADWKLPVPSEIAVDLVPKHELLAYTVKEMSDGGASLHAIATALGQSYATVRNALIFARCGERPKAKPAGRRTGTRAGLPKFITLSAKVAQLRDVEHVPFCDIAARLQISEATVRRAYDHAHRDEVREAALNGQRVTRGRFVRIEHAIRCEIRERLARGETPDFIAVIVGCSAASVRLIGRGK